MFRSSDDLRPADDADAASFGNAVVLALAPAPIDEATPGRLNAVPGATIGGGVP